MTTPAPLDWFWEGNIVETLARFLVSQGWSIVSMADTSSKAQGVDLHAQRGEQTLLVEAKGFPSKHYRDPRKAGQLKPTSPTLQAQHWFSHAVLKAMRLQTQYPEATVALAFPDFPRYRTLYEETRGGLAKLGVSLFVIDYKSEVTVWGA